MAVMQSLLSLASLHRFGPQSHAARLKISALETLAASLTLGISAKEGLQYIAAGMLLCSYEAQQSSASSGEWLLHIRGAKDIISTVMIPNSSARDTDFIPMLDWVFYHDALSRFSIRHWRRQETARQPYIIEPMIETMWCGISNNVIDTNSQLIKSSRTILCFLSSICDTVVGPSDPRHNTEDYRSFLELLYWEIMRIPIPESETQDPGMEEGSCVASGIELCKLAALVYLERATGGFSEKKSKASQRIERAFSIFSRLEACERQFPLLVTPVT